MFWQVRESPILDQTGLNSISSIIRWNELACCGREVVVPEGQHDRSLARSAWASAPRENRPGGYGMIGQLIPENWNRAGALIFSSAVFSEKLEGSSLE